MAVIITADLSYSARGILAALPPEKYDSLKGTKIFVLPDEQAKVSDFWGNGTFTGELQELEPWFDADIPIELKRVRGLHYSTSQPMDELLRMAKLEKVPFSAVNVINVTVANDALFRVDRVTYLEDCCTDELQRFLDRKWRILAVCPPNDSRRPTYIMGREGEE